MVISSILKNLYQVFLVIPKHLKDGTFTAKLVSVCKQHDRKLHGKQSSLTKYILAANCYPY